MSKSKPPVTAAIRFLRRHQVPFETHEYDYVEHGGAARSAACLGVDVHCVVKTIVLANERKQGLMVLMHGDKQVSTRQLARLLGMKHIEAADAAQAQRWTGYLFGGTSPFGSKTALPVYVEQSIWDLPSLYINGGKRGFLVEIAPSALHSLKPQNVCVAV